MKEILNLLYTHNWRAIFLARTSNPLLQLFRYCFVGGGAFLIDFGLYCLLGWLGLHYLLAGVFSFLLGFIFNFGVSRRLIFHYSVQGADKVKELFAVIIISVIGLVLTEIFLFVGADLLQLDFRVSKIIASILVLFWNYAIRKLFVYKNG